MFIVGCIMVVAGIASALGGPGYPSEAQLLVYGAAIGLTGNGLILVMLGRPRGEGPPQIGMAEGKARVVETEEVDGAAPGHHLVEVTYEIRPKHGRRYRAKQRFIDDFSRIKKNERSKIYYDPDDPSQIRLI